ncbi:MAG: glycoside hydrolase family 3 C-terminal domain-containing protein [Clostridiales bacterium]|jgi:beta-glucosidase|nr:glycoside hydrolase family 3 C-terminal domain-containing protein [Clostridiales bacterium]
MNEIYKDKTKSANERAKDLLSRMTVPEKAAQMLQLPYSKMPRENAISWAEKGLGSFLHVLGDDARELQQTALKTRLGIPVIFGIDAIHGHGLNDTATIFPSQLAAACSWNRELIEQMGRVTAREVATDGLHWTFSPVLCLGRDARWGRVNETFGEDPYLAGELGVSIIKGYQGDSLSSEESILACAKHYLGYGEAVGARDSCDTEMTFRKAREVFLPPFKKAAEAGCATFMTAYGSIDSSPFTASEKALRHILKDEFGFEGFVVTDWDNVTSLVTNQHVAADMKEATYLAVKAGNDMIMTSEGFYNAAIKLIEEKKLDEKLLDDAVLRILRIKFQMGLFEQSEKKGKPGCFGCEEHLEINKELARESVVLLKNNGILPIKSKRIAVIGPNADDIRAQYGDWTYFTHPEPDNGSEPKRPYCTVLEGMRELAGEYGAEIFYSKGCSVLGKDDAELADADFKEAVKLAGECDAVVLVVGDVIEQTGETKDRADLSLSGAQNALFKQIKGLGKPVVTVLVSSKPLCIPEIAEDTDALLIAFNGGMFGGLAAAEAIYGKINPSGRLPISFPRHSGQIPVYYNSLPGWHGGKYMDLPGEALFTFGEGLAYTEYEYSGIEFDEKNFVLSVNVKNTGNMDGAETVQVYYRDLVSSVLTPVLQLIAFEKVKIGAGETKTVTFQLKKDDFALVTPDERRVVEPGAFEVMAGHCAKAESLLKVEFVI